MRARGGVHGLPQCPHRDHAPTRDLANRRHQHIEIPRQLDVLKPVVEDVHRAAELSLRQRAGQMSIGRHTYDRARHLSREHQRLITRLCERRRDRRAIRYDDDSVRLISAAIAAAQNRRPLAGVDQELRDGSHHRRFPSPAYGQIADADYRSGKTFLPLRLPLNATPPQPHQLAVEGIKQGV
jgi:hypothetical protein